MIVPCPKCGNEIQTAGIGWCSKCEVYTDWKPEPKVAEGEAHPTDGGDTRLIVIPWAELVSVNKRSGAVSRTSKEWRESLAAMRATVAKQNMWSKLHGPVRLSVWYHPPDHRRRDCSNYDKAVADSLIGAVYGDDSQVVEWAGFKMPVSDDPRAVVEVVAIRREAAA